VASLDGLDQLLTQIRSTLPDVRFVSSPELGAQMLAADSVMINHFNGELWPPLKQLTGIKKIAPFLNRLHARHPKLTLLARCDRFDCSCVADFADRAGKSWCREADNDDYQRGYSRLQQCRFIADAIDSILKQTHPVTEIIVVDDGSVDNTEQVVQCFPDHVRYYKQVIQGPSAARNQGIKNGRWRVDCVFLGCRRSMDAR